MKIPDNSQQHVDWKVKKNASLLSQTRQFFILKHSAGIAVTVRNMVRRRERNTDECPRCRAHDEHTKHIIQCPHKDAQKIFMTGYEEIVSWLQKITTKDMELEITNLIIEYRKGDNTHQDNNITNDNVIQAMQRQRAIGLYPWMCGFMCTDWAKLQALHFEDIGSRRCPQRWTAQLAEKLINIIFNLWNHRNETLHKHENTITEKTNNKLNTTIKTIGSSLPNMRLLTKAERRFFFRFATIQKIQERNIHRKRQCRKILV